MKHTKKGSIQSCVETTHDLFVELGKRGGSNLDIHKCWACGKSDEALGIISLDDYYKVDAETSPTLRETRLLLCRWCLPRFVNARLLETAERNGTTLCQEHDLLPVPIDVAECPCCKTKRNRHAK